MVKTDRCDKALPGLLKLYEKCELCGHRCGVNRLKGEKGLCAAPAEPVVYAYSPHHGEEPPISGTRGSGTIFFSLCPMKCVYCQNWRFSQSQKGVPMKPAELAGAMLELEGLSCHNINLVSPTHFMPGITEALRIAFSKGLSIPIVYNTGGYDSLRLIRLLNGIVDVYLPDMRYSEDGNAARYSSAPSYVEVNRTAVREMYRQVGQARYDGEGIIQKGLVIRLLVMPGHISGTETTIDFIKKEMGNKVYLSIMSQYYPAYKAAESRELSRGITGDEYSSVVRKMEEEGFENGWVQPFGGDFEDSFKGENF
jgi:putative pyruvate formate lyase activating enzyme